MSVSERVWAEKESWAARIGKQPTKVFLSPLMKARVLKETHSTEASAEVAHAYGSTLIGRSVMTLDWYEDPSLSGEEIRFE